MGALPANLSIGRMIRVLAPLCLAVLSMGEPEAEAKAVADPKADPYLLYRSYYGLGHHYYGGYPYYGYYGKRSADPWSCDIIVDWADPQEEPDDDTMSQVKVLYVRNLTATVTEEKLQEVFEEHGKVDRVKKIKDYAFVHFQDRDKAVVAMNALNHTDLLGANLEISLAKPPSDKKKKEEMLRKREARMMRAINSNEVAFRLSRMTMAPFAAFPAAYPFAAGLGGGIYPPRGGGNGG